MANTHGSLTVCRRMSDIVHAQTATTILLAAVAILQAHAFASPTVDGRFNPSEGYTTCYFLTLNVDRVGLIDAKGQLWTYQDPANADLYLAFTLPVTLTDNSYGANAVGWGAEAPSRKHHNFEDLIGSDRAQFVLTNCNREVVLDVVVDYLYQTGAGGATYDSGLASPSAGNYDGEVIAGDASHVTAATSLDYSFNTLGHILTTASPAADSAYKTLDPACSDWVFEVTYELCVAGDIFASSPLYQAKVPLVHASTNKIGKNKVWTEVDAAVHTPAPNAIFLTGIGLAFVRLLRRRRAL